MMENYVEQIHEATTENDLNGIIEQAAFDDSLTHSQYTRLYEMAMSRFYLI